MKNYLKNIILMLLALPAAFSCTTMTFDNEAAILDGHSLIVSGIVSDMETAIPLEGIKVSFKAYPQGKSGTKILSELNVYSDNKGTFRIEADGFTEELTCILNASDSEERYKEAEQTVNISWTGVSYDQKNGVFVVNAEEFKMERSR